MKKILIKFLILLFVICITAINLTIVYATGSEDIVATFTFDGNANDSSGNSNNLNTVGNISYESGIINNSLSIDNSNEYLYSNQTAFNFGTSDFSIAFWVKSSGVNGDPSIISNKDWNSGSNTGWVIAVNKNQDNGIEWNFKGSTGSRKDMDIGMSIDDNNWHHIAISHDRDGNADFYEDGVYKRSVYIGNSTGTIDSGLPTVIGQDGTKSYEYGLNAKLDDLRILRRTLTANEVTNLYNQGLSVPTNQYKPNKSMWVWNADEIVSNNTINEDNQAIQNLINFCTSKNINKIYFNMYPAAEILNNSCRNLISSAHNAGITVEALSGSPDWYSNHTWALARVQDVINYNNNSLSNEKFDGIHHDVEFYTNINYSSGTPEWTQEYLNRAEGFLNLMVQTKTICSNNNLSYTVDIPRWLDNKPALTFNGLTKTIDKHAIDIADCVSIMSYQSNYTNTNTDCKNELEYAGTVGKTVYIGFLTSSFTNEAVLNEQISKSIDPPNSNLTQFFSLTTGESTSGFGGVAIHDYSSYLAY